MGKIGNLRFMIILCMLFCLHQNFVLSKDYSRYGLLTVMISLD